MITSPEHRAALHLLPPTNQQSCTSMIMVRKTYEKQTTPRSGSPASTVSRSEGSEGGGSDTDTADSNNQEEFYKYLGIHMRPHEIIQRPDITDLDIFKRRSLRVRYQKIEKQTEETPKENGAVKEEAPKVTQCFASSF